MTEERKDTYSVGDYFAQKGGKLYRASAVYEWVGKHLSPNGIINIEDEIPEDHVDLVKPHLTLFFSNYLGYDIMILVKTIKIKQTKGLDQFIRSYSEKPSQEVIGTFTQDDLKELFGYLPYTIPLPKDNVAMVEAPVPISPKESPISRLVEALNNDPEYRQGWIANIAMAFKDQFTYDQWDDYRDYGAPNKTIESPESIHEKANKAAESFINMLCRENK